MESKTGEPDVYELPLAATFVINQKGQLIWSFVKSDYTKRAEPEAIIQALKTAIP